jgi:hypothetical protein
MTEAFIAAYMMVGFARARHYARWFWDNQDEIGVFMSWAAGSWSWPLIDGVLLLIKTVTAIPRGRLKRVFIAGDPKPVRKARELERRRERVRELERELEL